MGRNRHSNDQQHKRDKVYDKGHSAGVELVVAKLEEWLGALPSILITHNQVYHLPDGNDLTSYPKKVRQVEKPSYRIGHGRGCLDVRTWFDNRMKGTFILTKAAITKIRRDLLPKEGEVSEQHDDHSGRR